MHDHAPRLATPSKCRLQRRTWEPSVNARAGRPANNLAGVKIQHDGRVQPALRSPKVSNIARPILIRSIGTEVMGKQIRRHTEGMARVGSGLKAFCCAGPRLLPAHALGHGLAVHGHAFCLHLLSKAGRAVAAFLRH